MPLAYDVLSYGADPTGSADSTHAFNTAIAAAAAHIGDPNRPGHLVWIPPGAYRLDDIVDVCGVTLEGPGSGNAQGAARLNLGARAAVILHSGASGPYYAPGGASLRGLDLTFTRPTFRTWSPGAAYAEGDCIRPMITPGNHSTCWECVSGGTAGDDPALFATRYDIPIPARTWTPHARVSSCAVRFASTGRLDVQFTAQNTTGALPGFP